MTTQRGNYYDCSWYCDRQITATSESFLPEVNDFIDFVIHKHQNRIAEPKLPHDIAKAWAKGFEEVDRVEERTNEPDREFKLH